MNLKIMRSNKTYISFAHGNTLSLIFNGMLYSLHISS